MMADMVTLEDVARWQETGRKRLTPYLDDVAVALVDFLLPELNTYRTYGDRYDEVWVYSWAYADERQRMWFLRDVVSRLGPGGRILWVGFDGSELEERVN